MKDKPTRPQLVFETVFISLMLCSAMGMMVFATKHMGESKAIPFFIMAFVFTAKGVLEIMKYFKED